MRTVRFEPLTEPRIPAILVIEKTSQSAPWSEQSFKNELGNRHSIFSVLIVDGEVAGYGGIWVVIDEAHITNIAVRDELRGQGLGRRLLDHLMTQAVERGATSATLEVRASNLPAISLYEKAGFKTCARRKGYYPDNREDALVMWLYDLSPWQK